MNRTGICSLCGVIGTTELHHIKYKDQGGADTDDNLIEVCRDCHRLIHSGAIKKAVVLAAKNRQKGRHTMNKYVNAMKNTITNFSAAMKKVADQKIKNSNMYRDDIAADENAKMDTQAQQLFENAREEITATQKEAVAQAEAWGELNGGDIDPDINLLKGGFTLDGKDLDRLIEKHQNNGTMIKAIADYAQTHKIMLSWIPTVYTKQEAFARLAAEADSTLGAIYQNPTGSPMLDEGIAHWGEGNGNTNFWRTIGE